MQKYLAIALVCAIALVTGGALLATQQAQQSVHDSRKVVFDMPTDGIVQNAGRDQLKKKHRDARYSDPDYIALGFTPFSKLPDGAKRVSTEGVPVQIEEPSADAAVETAKMVKTDAALRRSVACSAALVVHGYVKKHEGVITSDDSSIYTVYTFVIGNVLRAKSGITIRAGSEIEFTKAGGFAIVDGKTVGKENVAIRGLSLASTHALFLQYDAEADDYYVDQAAGVYSIAPDGKMGRADATSLESGRALRRAQIPLRLADLEAEVKAANCEGGQK